VNSPKSANPAWEVIRSLQIELEGKHAVSYQDLLPPWLWFTGCLDRCIFIESTRFFNVIELGFRSNRGIRDYYLSCPEFFEKLRFCGAICCNVVEVISTITLYFLV
jgi:hypothetical protein